MNTRKTENEYIVTGRVQGEESIMKVIIAGDELIAMNIMEHFLKTEQEWTVGEDVYVDAPVLLENAKVRALTESTPESIKERYKKSLNGDIKDVSFSFVISYEIATQFNGWDQELVLNYLLENVSETEAHFDEDTEVLSVTRYDEVAAEVNVNNKDELIAFWHTMCAQEHVRLVDLYQDNELLLETIDSEGVDFSDVPGMPR